MCHHLVTWHLGCQQCHFKLIIYCLLLLPVAAQGAHTNALCQQLGMLQLVQHISLAHQHCMQTWWLWLQATASMQPQVAEDFDVLAAELGQYHAG